MADSTATASASIVPDTFAQDIATLEVAIEAETGVTSAVDPGGAVASDNVVSVEASASDAGTKAQYTNTLGGADGGTFQFTVNGVPTAAIDFDAANSVVKAALEALPHVVAVTVTGTSPITIVFDDPIRVTTLNFVDIDLTNATTPGETSTVTGIPPSTVTAAAVITDAITAVGDCQLAPGTAVEVAGNPDITSSDADNAITVAEEATGEITFTTALLGATTVTMSAADEAGDPLASTLFTFTDHGDQDVHAADLGQAQQRQGEATLAIHPPDSSAGTHYVVVIATDENGRKDHIATIVTISA